MRREGGRGGKETGGAPVHAVPYCGVVIFPVQVGERIDEDLILVLRRHIEVIIQKSEYRYVMCRQSLRHAKPFSSPAAPTAASELCQENHGRTIRRKYPSAPPPPPSQETAPLLPRPVEMLHLLSHACSITWIRRARHIVGSASSIATSPPGLPEMTSAITPHPSRRRCKTVYSLSVQGAPQKHIPDPLWRRGGGGYCDGQGGRWEAW
jgi:hypothetical protein